VRPRSSHEVDCETRKTFEPVAILFFILAVFGSLQPISAFFRDLFVAVYSLFHFCMKQAVAMLIFNQFLGSKQMHCRGCLRFRA
jgi:hypothetical protein